VPYQVFSVSFLLTAFASYWCLEYLIVFICSVQDVANSFASLQLKVQPVLHPLTFKIRHWNSLFDEQKVQCDAQAFFETVRLQFKLGLQDFAVYHFPPGPPGPTGEILRTKLSKDCIEAIEWIGRLANQPCLYLHSAVDNVDAPFGVRISAESFCSLTVARRCVSKTC
jgi:hypothetical protein